MYVSVVYPVSFNVDPNELVDSDGQPLTGDALRNAILDLADELLINNTVRPVIVECDNPDLVD